MFCPNSSIVPVCRGRRPRIVRKENGLARPRTADEAENLATLDVQIQTVEHLHLAERNRDVARAEHDRPGILHQ